MTQREHRTRPPLTSRVWFFPALILLMPLISRVGVSLLSPSSEQRRLAKSDEEVCIEYYNECVGLCGPEGSTTYDECVAICYEEFELCIEEGPSIYDGPTCDPAAGYCGYDDNDNYDYGDFSGDDGEAGWTCDPADSDDFEWGCSSSDDYSDDSDSSSDGGGWDCSADNYDEGDSGDDGDDWGEDWGERSLAGGDGIEPPPDLPH